MGWTKGVSRKGYVTKDGKPHARRGYGYSGRGVESYVQRITQREQTFDMERETEVPELHGQRDGRAVVEVCPSCSFAYANGGYCESCGYTAETRVMPYNSVQRRKFT
jgi:hypothetical protein